MPVTFMGEGVTSQAPITWATTPHYGLPGCQISNSLPLWVARNRVEQKSAANQKVKELLFIDHRFVFPRASSANKRAYLYKIVQGWQSIHPQVNSLGFRLG